MKAREMRELPESELTHRLDEFKEEYFNLRFQNATGQLENYKQMHKLKRDIARAATIMHERELNIEVPEPAPLPVRPPRDEKPKKAPKSKRSEEEVENQAPAAALEEQEEVNAG